LEAYFYRQSGEISEQDKEYIKKFAFELERDFLIDLLVMNLTGKDFLQQGQIIRNCSISTEREKGDSFVEILSKKSEPHMLEIVKSMNDSHLDSTVMNVHKLIHVAGEFYNMLYEEQLVREQKRELGSE